MKRYKQTSAIDFVKECERNGVELSLEEGMVAIKIDMITNPGLPIRRTLRDLQFLHEEVKGLLLRRESRGHLKLVVSR